MSIETQPLLAELGLTARPVERKRELGQDDFLRLMTEQLKNQDPLKPLASNEFLGQLAQFSTVQGIESLNASFAALVSGVDSDRTLQAAALVGQQVLVAGDRFRLSEGGGLSGEVEAPAAGPITIEIADAGGAVVRRFTVEADAAGPLAFTWDGLGDTGEALPAGDYRIAARFAQGSQTLAVPTYLSTRIDSVSLTAQGPILNLAGLGRASLADVRRFG